MRLCPVAAVVTLSASVLAAQEAGPPPPPTPRQMSMVVDRGRLTATIVDYPLHDVLEELSARSGITFVPGDGLDGERISAELQRLPLDEGVRRLLQHYDSFLYYGAVDQDTPSSLRAVWVFPKGQAITLRPVSPEVWASTKEAEASLADPNPLIREQAYRMLMSRPGSGNLELVLLALRGASETDEGLRQRLLSTAFSQGLDVPADLLVDLVRNDISEEIRAMALDGLAGNPDARDVATFALSDPSEAVRNRAKNLLAEIDAIRSREAIGR